MTIEINEEQISYIKSLDSDKKRKEFLLTAIIENITSLGESAKFEIKDQCFPKWECFKKSPNNKVDEKEKISGYCQILCDIKANEIMSREKPKGIDLNVSFLQKSLDGDISLELCQDLKNLCVKFQNYEFASRFRHKEKLLLGLISPEEGKIKTSKISDFSSKIHPKEMDWTTTTAPRTFEGILNRQEYGTEDFNFGKAYVEAIDRIIPQNELLKFDAMDEPKRSLTVFEIIKSSDYFKELLENCFNESRLTHPMIGFKHETFKDYFKTIDGK